MIDIEKHFHTIGIREVLYSLKTSRTGLSGEEVEKRLPQFGINQIPEEKKYSRFQLFLSQFHDSLIYILILAFFVSLALRNYIDAIFIAIVILINAILGFFQEDKVAKALVLLKKAVQVYVRVMRNGQEFLLESTKLVPGDIMILQAGDKVSADARLIEARELEVNEAALTGESFPVAKTLSELSYTKVTAEQTNMLFAGTLIERGRAVAVVTATGDDTELGKIALALKETKETSAPLQIKVSHFTRLLSIVILVFTGILFAVDFLSGKPFADIFASSLAFAVSAIPAGLPPLITVILVLGMKRLLRQKTLVKSLVFFRDLNPIPGLYYPITVYSGIDGIYEIQNNNVEELDKLQPSDYSIFGLNYSYRSVVTTGLRTQEFFVEFLHKNLFKKYLATVEWEARELKEFFKFRARRKNNE